MGILSPGEDIRAKIAGLMNLLEAARLGGVSRISVASSIAVYAGLTEGPFREDQRLPIGSSNPVEAFKKSIETLSLHYAEPTTLDVIVLPIAAIWGPLYRSMFNLPSRMVHGALKKGRVDFSSDAGGIPYVKTTLSISVKSQTARPASIRSTHQNTWGIGARDFEPGNKERRDPINTDLGHCAE